MIALALLATCSLGQTAGEGTSDPAAADAPAAVAPAKPAAPAEPEAPPPSKPGFVRPPGIPSWIPDSFIDDDPFLKEPVPINQLIPATVGGGGVLAGIGFYLYAHHLEEKIRGGDPAITTDQQLLDAIGVGKIYEAIGLSLIALGSAGVGYAFYLRYFVPREPEPVWTPKSRRNKPKAELWLQPARGGGAVGGVLVEWP